MTAKVLPKKIVILAGPTAIGKTELSLTLADHFGAEIVSMDSMQIYKYMDIGTAKPTEVERRRALHHLIDFVEPDEPYHVARYVEDAEKTIDDITTAGHLPLLVGGTGLYMRGVLHGIFTMPPVPDVIRSQVALAWEQKGAEQMHAELSSFDPESADRIHPRDRQRLTRAFEVWHTSGVPLSKHIAHHQQQCRQRPSRFSALMIGLCLEREALYERINRRVFLMVELGLLEEVERLLNRGFKPTLKSMKSLGYRHMVDFLGGRCSWPDTLNLLARDTRRYAKRQMTWFSGEKTMRWFAPHQQKQVIRCIEEYLQNGGS